MVSDVCFELEGQFLLIAPLKLNVNRVFVVVDILETTSIGCSIPDIFSSVDSPNVSSPTIHYTSGAGVRSSIYRCLNHTFEPSLIYKQIKLMNTRQQRQHRLRKKRLLLFTQLGHRRRHESVPPAKPYDCTETTSHSGE